MQIKKHPLFQTPQVISQVQIARQRLSNQLPVYTLPMARHDIIRLDLVFQAGSSYQPQPLVAAFTNQLITEGAGDLSAEELAHRIDFYGAYLETSLTKDWAEVSLVTTSGFFKQALPLLERVVKQAWFPANDFELWRKNQKQRFSINQQKTDFVATQAFNKALFGPKHPYGQVAQTTDFDYLSREALVEFYQNHYQARNVYAFICGAFDNKHLNLLNKHLGGDDWNKAFTDFRTPNVPVLPAPRDHLYLPVPGAVQNSLRVGKATIGKQHPDFQELQLVNMVLGGYFSSRLMTNIREKHGFSYGIYSYLQSFQHSGVFYIAADVGKDVATKAINEIRNELRRLRTEWVPEEELQLVKNYFRGELLRDFDGIWHLPDTLRSLLDFNLPDNYYEHYFQQLNSLTAERIRQLAHDYLHEDSMLEIVAGPE